MGLIEGSELLNFGQTDHLISIKNFQKDSLADFFQTLLKNKSYCRVKFPKIVVRAVDIVHQLFVVRLQI